jgi:hypothetical protein
MAYNCTPGRTERERRKKPPRPTHRPCHGRRKEKEKRKQVRYKCIDKKRKKTPHQKPDRPNQKVVFGTTSRHHQQIIIIVIVIVVAISIGEIEGKSPKARQRSKLPSARSKEESN